MPRVEITETVLQASPSGVLRAVTGALVTVTNRVGGALATVYAAETGAATLANPLTSALGRVEGWVELGEYSLAVSFTQAGATVTYTQPWEASPAESIQALNTGLALKQDAATAATDVEVAAVSRLISKGLLGATPSEALLAGDQRVTVVGMLNVAAVVFTLTGLVAGQQGRFVLTQDATGSRTFALTAAGSTAAAVTVTSAAGSVSFVEWSFDGTDMFVKGA